MEHLPVTPDMAWAEALLDGDEQISAQLMWLEAAHTKYLWAVSYKVQAHNANEAEIAEVFFEDRNREMLEEFWTAANLIAQHTANPVDGLAEHIQRFTREQVIRFCELTPMGKSATFHKADDLKAKLLLGASERSDNIARAAYDLFDELSQQNIRNLFDYSED